MKFELQKFIGNQPVNWQKVSAEAMNIIKGFIDVFYFEDMLHGSNISSSISSGRTWRESGLPTGFINRRRVDDGNPTLSSPLASPSSLTYDEIKSPASRHRLLGRPNKESTETWLIKKVYKAKQI